MTFEDHIGGSNVTVGDVGGMNQGASTIQSPVPAHRTRASGRMSANPICMLQTQVYVCNQGLGTHHVYRLYSIFWSVSPTMRDRSVFFDPCSMMK